MQTENEAREKRRILGVDAYSICDCCDSVVKNNEMTHFNDPYGITLLTLCHKCHSPVEQNLPKENLLTMCRKNPKDYLINCKCIGRVGDIFPKYAETAAFKTCFVFY